MCGAEWRAAFAGHIQSARELPPSPLGSAGPLIGYLRKFICQREYAPLEVTPLAIHKDANLNGVRSPDGRRPVDTIECFFEVPLARPFGRRMRTESSFTSVWR